MVPMVRIFYQILHADFSTVPAAWSAHVVFHNYYVWRSAQIMKLLIMQVPPASYYFNPLGCKYSPQHSVLKHSQSLFSSALCSQTLSVCSPQHYVLKHSQSLFSSALCSQTLCLYSPQHSVLKHSQSLFSSAFCSQTLSQSLFSSALCSQTLSVSILLSTLFSNTLSLYFSLGVRDQVSYPYSTTVLHILIFTFLDSNRNGRGFWTEW
jgi:hypothetical protein